MKKLALLLSLALSFSAIADDHAPTSSYLVESIPFTLKDGKTMADMMAMKDEFAAVAQASGLQYSAFVMTPHYMSQSSAPIAGSFDAVWLGFSPSATAIGAGYEGYMENGQELEAKFDELRTMNQRSLMRGEMVHEGDPSDGGFGMFRTCTLNDGADMDELRAALKARGAAFEKAGATASTHMWYGGIGIPMKCRALSSSCASSRVWKHGDKPLTGILPVTLQRKKDFLMRLPPADLFGPISEHPSTLRALVKY